MKKIQKLHQRNADQFCWRKYLRTNLETEQSMRAMRQVSFGQYQGSIARSELVRDFEIFLVLVPSEIFKKFRSSSSSVRDFQNVLVLDFSIFRPGPGFFHFFVPGPGPTCFDPTVDLWLIGVL